MCAGTDDFTYAAFGGRWQRDNPVEGRVGSIFAPAGGMVIADEYPSDEAADETRAGEATEGETPADSATELLETSDREPVHIEEGDNESAPPEADTEGLLDVTAPGGTRSEPEQLPPSDTP